MIRLAVILLSSVSALTSANQTLYENAIRLHGEEKLEQAASIYRQIVRNEPNASRVWFDLGTAYVQQGQKSRALHAYDRASELEPQNLDYRNRTQAFRESLERPYIVKGTAALNAKNYPAAIKQFRKAVAICPQDHLGWYYLGLCYKDMKDYGKAQIALKEAISIHSDDAYKRALESVGGQSLQKQGPDRERFGDFGNRQAQP